VNRTVNVYALCFFILYVYDLM